MKRIRVVSMGGTISTESGPGAGTFVPRRSGEEIVAALGAEVPGVEIEVEDFARVLSSELTLPQVHGLARRLAEILREDRSLDGIVVTQGTGAMEETAFWADLTVADPRPIVFTGAMRGASDPFADGRFNLWNAIRAAASPATRELGALVQFDGLLHAAREVVKVHTTRTNPYESPEFGPIGRVYPDRVHVARLPSFRAHVEAEEPEYRVDLLKFAVGMDAHLVEASVAWGARAIVVEGSGLGNVNTPVAEALLSAVRGGVTVILASRCAEGRVFPMYSTSGGGASLLSAGCLATALPGPKARILAMLALGAGLPRERLAELLDPEGGAVR